LGTVEEVAQSPIKKVRRLGKGLFKVTLEDGMWFILDRGEVFQIMEGALGHY